MNLRRPVIRLPGEGNAHKIAKRVEPKIAKPATLGPCLLCGDTYEGPTSIRLKQGCISNLRRKAEFVPLPFDDHTNVKWLCIGCALDNNIVSEDVKWFSSLLKGLSSDGQCCLCGQVIEPYPLKEWSSAILIELGDTLPGTKGPFSVFRPRIAGHLHYFCMDFLNLELWRIIDTSDEPDYKEHLPACR